MSMLNRPRTYVTALALALLATGASVACKKNDDLVPKEHPAAEASVSADPLDVDAGPPAPPGEELWFTFDKKQPGPEVRASISNEGLRSIASYTVVTYAYDATGMQLARTEKTFSTLLRPDDVHPIDLAPVADGAVGYEAIVAALTFADGAKESWRDSNVAPPLRLRTKDGAGINGVAFAGSYQSTEGPATIEQLGDHVTIDYQDGHAHCLARGRTLHCTWHEKHDYGGATLTMDHEGKLHGTWGVGKSDKDGGDWHFLPSGEAP
jgi:hypothetical protein